jgi:hypothetical protein
VESLRFERLDAGIDKRHDFLHKVDEQRNES